MANNPGLMERALDMISGELDDVEGRSAGHSPEECPDPLTCTQHDGQAGESLDSNLPTLPRDETGTETVDSLDRNGSRPAIVEVTMEKKGTPSRETDKLMEGKDEGDSRGIGSEGMHPEKYDDITKIYDNNTMSDKNSDGLPSLEGLEGKDNDTGGEEGLTVDELDTLAKFLKK